MRYHTNRPDISIKVFGVVKVINHPLYRSGTVFVEKDRGLVIIQQYFNVEDKTTFWGPIEYWLANTIYTNKDFRLLFDKYSSEKIKGYYPTITIRHAMNWLKIKPLKKERWETVFDRVII